MSQTGYLLAAVRIILITCCLSWLAALAFVLSGVLSAPERPVHSYGVLIAVLSAVGILSALAYIKRLPYGRAAVLAVLVACSALSLLRFYGVFLRWRIAEGAGISEALQLAFSAQYALLAHYFGKGWFVEGFLLLNFEWVFPALVLTAAAAVAVTSNYAFKRTRGRD